MNGAETYVRGPVGAPVRIRFRIPIRGGDRCACYGTFARGWCGGIFDTPEKHPAIRQVFYKGVAGR